MPYPLDRLVLEPLVKGWLARFARLISWEPLESIRSFIEVLSPCIIDRLQKELPEALRKNRVNDLEKRAFRWLERLFWEDISHHPDDPLDKRTLRLKRLFDDASEIPSRQGEGEHFPVSIFIEYESLLNALKPAFKRRPATLAHLPKEKTKFFVDQTIGGGRGFSRPRVLDALNQKHSATWQASQLQRANRVIQIHEWSRDQQFQFEAEDVIGLTPRTAALKILATKLNLSAEAVSKLVKRGKKILSPTVLKKLENANAGVQDDATWQFLNQFDPLR